MDLGKILKDIDLRMTNIGYNSLFRSFVPNDLWGHNPRIRIGLSEFHGPEEPCYSIVASNKTIFEGQSSGIVRAGNFFRYLRVE